MKPTILCSILNCKEKGLYLVNFPNDKYNMNGVNWKEPQLLCYSCVVSQYTYSLSLDDNHSDKIQLLSEEAITVISIWQIHNE